MLNLNLKSATIIQYTIIWHACGRLFISPNTLSHSTILKTTNSKRYKFWTRENLWFKAFGKEKKLWQGQKAVLRLFMKIFWAILADCYPKSAFLMNSPTFISHKEWDNRKRKGGGERAFLVASTLGENGCLVPQLYLSRHI